MYMSRVLLGLGAMGFVLLGCDSKPVPKQSETPLTVEQLDNLESATRSLDQAYEAVTRASILSGSEIMTGIVGSGRKMAEKINKTVCQYRLSPKGGAKPPAESFMVVDGASCPIYFQSNKKRVEGGRDFSTTLKLDYEVRTSAYREMNDIDRLNFDGSLGVRSQIRGAEFYGRVEGMAHSQNLGNISLRIEKSGLVTRDGGTGQLVIRMTTKTFIAKGIIETHYNGNGDQVGRNHWINGIPFSEKDFKDIFGQELATELANL